MPAKKNRRILVIDDNPAIHDDFRKILSPDTIAAAALDVTATELFGQPTNAVREIHYEIDSAYQGQDGVLLVKQALAAGRPYAMAFVDIRMPPGWDGVETTRKIWAVDPEVQIVLCTAYADYSWDEMFEKIGNSDRLVILKKPFDTVEALQLAHALTEKWWLHQQSRQKMEELERMVAERTRELQQTNQSLQTEVVEHQRAEESLRLVSSAVEQAKESILITDAKFDLPGPKIIFVNPAFTQMTGYSAEEAIGKTPDILFHGPHTDPILLSQIMQNLERGEAFAGEAINYRKDGKELNLELEIAPIRNASGKITHFVAIQRDITERKRLEAQLFQSQKMETVGKLAGGIAHEFNSILTAIICQSELLMEDLPAGSPLAKNAVEISSAAGRAATLTRQLLAYGRRQFLQPELLDLNAVLAGMASTLGHLMGRGADVRIVPAAGLKAVKADAGQLEQVIMNIAMNAADAMPNGGKLTLETANVSFDQESVGRYPELKPGDYVMLAITDTGTGMSEKVKARVFEPFFTTKGVGQGAGLGLSTCYGIIKQSGGHISVYSELARGATFKIYLPQVEPQTKIPPQRLDLPDLPRGTETILLVEDDPAMREMAATLLSRLGYTVLAAANGIEALSLKQQRDTGHIDLLFTDVVMPHMSGKELADRVQALYPHTRILFTSAYTENAIVHQGVLDPGVALLQKPFTPSALAHKLREVLDQPASGSEPTARRGVPQPDSRAENI
ncbi:MAG TPA: response regulator [Candidatus Limnocylindrales bacterium]|nr:response regulator [Candidatus Limnocylindrales bacterium]